MRLPAGRQAGLHRFLIQTESGYRYVEIMLEVVEAIANAIDGLVVIMLVLGMLLSFARALQSLLARQRLTGTVRQLRVDLGQVLLLSLEVLIVSDILHSIVKRTLEEVGILAVVVIIRIALSYFLDREIEHLQAERDHLV
ncbi:hypothetical protein Mal4_55750 [Maioricimonas rarisocia]|uniref:DUF1622 domain-containing protein n=1 Tax=Maioricimonas rarisocia TaxID=2528026 RepID=A0A517ZFE0_9PLAN|nr:DUF1622 domain-containing protein [Maioricimonas rarisocia]QDU41210.1 hypothetical protein Mal4_55750 [Maioricimonas rarisocia]